MSRSIRFAFIVLHYNEKSLDDTHECVRSILKLEGSRESRVVIVENGSGDRSAEELQKVYSSNPDVDVVVSDKNLGFANGNNLGCRFAVKKFAPRFLIVINNDTVFIQPDFTKILLDIYDQEKFDILGPYIIDKNGEPQNPHVSPLTDLDRVESKILNIRKKLELIRNSRRISRSFRVLLIRLKAFFASFALIRFLFSKKRRNLRRFSRERIRGIALHGSALVFSDQYYRKYDNVFYEKTFMFGEEDILFQRVLQDKLVSVYSPELKIFHKEDSSTNSVFRKSLEKKLFIHEKELESLHILADVIREGVGK